MAPFRTSAIRRPVFTWRMLPPASLNSTTFPACAKDYVEISGRSTSATWKGMLHLWPSEVANWIFCCP